MRPSVLPLLVAGVLPLAFPAARALAAPFAYVPNFGSAMRAKLLVKGKGAHLGNPAPPLVAAVTVQLVRGDGTACWEATFTTPTVNDQGRFNARSD